MHGMIYGWGVAAGTLALAFLHGFDVVNAALGETLVLELLGVGALWSRSEAASLLVPPICSGQAVLSLVKQGKLHSQLLPLMNWEGGRRCIPWRKLWEEDMMVYRHQMASTYQSLFPSQFLRKGNFFLTCEGLSVLHAHQYYWLFIFLVLLLSSHYVCY